MEPTHKFQGVIVRQQFHVSSSTAHSFLEVDLIPKGIHTQTPLYTYVHMHTCAGWPTYEVGIQEGSGYNNS